MIVMDERVQERHEPMTIGLLVRIRPKAGREDDVEEVFCSENIQAAKIAKQGFRNSEGCSESGPSEIQRVAPLIWTPVTSVSAVSPKKTKNRMTPRRRTCLADSIDTNTTVASASGSMA